MKIISIKSRAAYTIVLLYLTACSASPLPTITATVTAAPSMTPFIPSITLSSFNTITPTSDFCSQSQWQDEIRVMSGLLFTALEPGGPVEFDRILVEQNPKWVDFGQEVEGEGFWKAGQIFASFAWGYDLGTGVNPAVILVTYGVEQNWELPADGDLISDVDNIRAILHHYESEWILGKVDQSQYPPLANAATYALYRYFNGDLSQLEDWCYTYVRVYDQSPLKTFDK